MNSSGFWKRCWPDASGWARISFLLLALILTWHAPAPAIGQTTNCGSYAAAVAPQQVGHPLSDDLVRLVDIDGESASFAVSQPGTVMPSSRDGVAIVRSLGGIFSLLDTASGTVTPLQIPEDRQPLVSFDLLTYRNAAKSDFMLFPTGPNAVWLVDLRSGQAVDLVDLLPTGGAIDSASIAPGGKWLEYFSRDGATLISLESLDDPIRVSEEPILPFPGFTADGRALIYATESPDGVDIWSRDVATGRASTIGNISSANALDATSSERVLLIDGQTLMALPNDGSAPEAIFSWKGAPRGSIGDSTGRYLLTGDDRGESGVVWSRIDTETGISHELPELTDMTPMLTGGQQDAVTFVPSPKVGPGTPGAPYRTVDLATGQVSTVLTQDSSEVWMFEPGGDDAGRYALIDAVSPGEGRMWLIDGEYGASTQIGSSTGNLTARVSPDGCQLAVAVFDTVGEGRTSVVTVTSLIDGSAIATVPNTILLGWAETAGSSES